MTEVSPVTPTIPSEIALGDGRTNAGSRKTTLVVLALVVAVLCAYGMVGQADFIHYDDNSHVFENPAVTRGLTWAGVWEAFKPHASLWVPLTTLSFMADVSLFGLNPGAMHLVNLAWHTATVVLLFFTLRRLTDRFWESAFVAALFGLHPINVESVAWVTERKNVLCAFFWVSSIAAYIRYAERPRITPYALSLGAAAFALLAKPMAATIPCTLLLLDWWPLRNRRTAHWTHLLLEKAPFFALAIAASLIQMASRRESELVTLETVTLGGRVSNALISYATYLRQLVCPGGFGVFYPHPVNPQPWLEAGAGLLLVAITTAAWVMRKRSPYFLFGWLWFIGTLVPMIGLVQAGSQARADRFTYIPQLGIFLAITWVVAELRPIPARAMAVTAGILLLVLGSITVRQVSYWQHGAALFEHTIAVTKNNACAYAIAGIHRAREGSHVKALEHFQASLRILPDQATIWREAGTSLLRLGKSQEAVNAFRQGLKYEPADFRMRYQLAVALRQSGDNEEAFRISSEMLDQVPRSAGLHYNLALVLESQGNSEAARQHLSEAATLAPQDQEIKAALERVNQ